MDLFHCPKIFLKLLYLANNVSRAGERQDRKRGRQIDGEIGHVRVGTRVEGPVPEEEVHVDLEALHRQGEREKDGGEVDATRPEVLGVDVDTNLAVLPPLRVLYLARQDQPVVLLLVIVKVVAEPGDL